MSKKKVNLLNFCKNSNTEIFFKNVLNNYNFGILLFWTIFFFMVICKVCAFSGHRKNVSSTVVFQLFFNK